MEKTDYEKELIPKLTGLHLDVWYKIEPNRQDKENFVEAIKKRIDTHNDFLFNEDYSKFKRVEPFKKENYPMHGQITFKIEWRKQEEVEIDYSHLPEPTYTPENKIVKRRAQ